MKGLLKKVVGCVMVSGMLFASCAGLAGCSGKTVKKGEYVLGTNEYIIYNNTLHKGDIVTDYIYIDDGHYNSAPSPIPTLRFVCGLGERDTTMYVSSKEHMPRSDEYDHICEECFEIFEEKE